MQVTILTRTEGQPWTLEDCVKLGRGLKANVALLGGGRLVVWAEATDEDQIAAAIGHRHFRVRLIDATADIIPEDIRQDMSEAFPGAA